MDNQQPIPEGYKQVTEEEFFVALAAEKRDIMPTTREPLHTIWETKNREPWGWSYPGWKIPRMPHLYAIKNTAP